MRRNPVVSEVSDLLIPAILLFGLYVQFHGDFGPGGGFQAGVILSVAIILYALIHGLARTRQLIPARVLHVMMSLGVLLYVGVGLVSIGMNAEFLNFNVLSDDQRTAQHIGIFLVELGIGATVASVITVLFYAFADRMDE